MREHSLPIQVEDAEPKRGTGGSGASGLTGDRGQAEVAPVAENTGQDPAIPIPQPVPGGLAGDRHQFFDLTIVPVLDQGTPLDLQGCGRTGRSGVHIDSSGHQVLRLGSGQGHDLGAFPGNGGLEELPVLSATGPR